MACELSDDEVQGVISDVDAPSPDGVAIEIATREAKHEVAAWLARRRS